MFIHSISMDLHNVIEIILRYLEICINLFHLLHIMTMRFTYNQIVSHLILDPIGNHMHKRVRFKLWLKKCYINASFNLSKAILLHQMLMVHNVRIINPPLSNLVICLNRESCLNRDSIKPIYSH